MSIKARCVLLVSVLFLYNHANAAKQESPQHDPQSLITEFFRALKADDNKTLHTLLSPRKKKYVNEQNYWSSQKNLWRRCDVIKFQFKHKKRLPDNIDALFVPVEYKCSHRPNFKTRIRLRRIDGLWYWDQNAQ